MRRLGHARILMYSHDTFGLGHLRRCRTIAHALVEHFKGLHVLIISGSPIAGAFDFRARVDFVKIPSVIKLHNGEYTSMASHIDLHETLKMRESSIRHTAETFQPEVVLRVVEEDSPLATPQPRFSQCPAAGPLPRIADVPHVVEVVDGAARDHRRERAEDLSKENDPHESGDRQLRQLDAFDGCACGT